VKSAKEFYARAVSDTLDSIVSPGVRDTVLAEALTLAGEIAVPRRAREFRAFVRGPLSETLERALGADLGRAVVAELVRLAASAPVSSVPPKTFDTKRAPGRPLPRESANVPGPERSNLPEPASPTARRRGARGEETPTAPPVANRSPARNANAPTLPARPREAAPQEPREADDSSRPRGPGPVSNDYPTGVARAFGMLSSNPAAAASGARRLPIVFVATRDTELVRCFSAWLDPRASVVRVLRLSDLLLDIQDASDRKVVIVVDGQGPAIRVEALAALSDELPDNVSVVLWGGTRELTARLSGLFPRVSEWLICTDSTPLADIVDRCAEIVG